MKPCVSSLLSFLEAKRVFPSIQLTFICVVLSFCMQFLAGCGCDDTELPPPPSDDEITPPNSINATPTEMTLPISTNAMPITLQMETL